MHISELIRHLQVLGVKTANTVSESTNGKMGVATLIAGTVTISNKSITANSRIFLTPQNGVANAGFVSVGSRVNATSFTITSSNNLDTRIIAYQIFEPG